MADFEVQIEENMEENDGEVPADVEMGGEDVLEADHSATGQNGDGENGLPFQDEEEEEELPVRITYVDHLKSPIVELVVGEGEDQTLLTAHQALLVRSPFFEDACAQFGENTTQRRIELTTENLDAVGCFLEYLYTGEYFPQKIAGQRGLARDHTMPEVDVNGEQLLKHARVYTLADKFGVAALKTLAHSKIHCVNSSAKGEIAYARYVYATTPKEDDTIRRPVASFWAHRSHVLRAEAEDEFRQMCLEFPQFGFDVLTRVLDEKLKNEKTEKPHSGPASSRKRQRQSQG